MIKQNAKLIPVSEPYRPGVAGLQFSATVASWHGKNWREILNFEHLPKLNPTIPLSPELTNFENELNKFKTKAAEIAIKFQEALCLNVKQVDEIFLPLLKSAEPLAKKFKHEFREVIQTLESSHAFLISRSATGQNNYFHELCSNILTEGYLVLGRLSGDVESVKKLEEFITKSKSSRRTRHYSFMLKESSLRGIERGISEGVTKKELEKLIKEAKQIWRKSDARRVNLLTWDNKFDLIFDFMARNPDLAKITVKLARLEFDWESWETPDILLSKHTDNRAISNRLDSKPFLGFNSPRKTLGDNNLTPSWIFALAGYPQFKGIILRKALSERVKRNSFIPEKDSLVRFNVFSKKENLDPGNLVLESVVDLQKDELAQIKSEAGSRGMLRVIEAHELKRSLDSGSHLICQWEGEQLISFSIFNTEQTTGNELAVSALGKIEQRAEDPISFIELIVQRSNSGLKIARNYKRGANYKLVLNATDSVLHAHHPTRSVTECAVCRTYPTPNLAMSSHLREGWESQGELQHGGFRFAIIKRTLSGSDPRMH